MIMFKKRSVVRSSTVLVARGKRGDPSNAHAYICFAVKIIVYTNVHIYTYDQAF